MDKTFLSVSNPTDLEFNAILILLCVFIFVLCCVFTIVSISRDVFRGLLGINHTQKIIDNQQCQIDELKRELERIKNERS